MTAMRPGVGFEPIDCEPGCAALVERRFSRAALMFRWQSNTQTCRQEPELFAQIPKPLPQTFLFHLGGPTSSYQRVGGWVPAGRQFEQES